MTRPSQFAGFCLAVGVGATLAAADAPPKWRVAGGFSTDWEHLAIDTVQLRPHVYLLHGSGGNTVALTGPEGTLIVDSEFAQVAPRLQSALLRLGAGPVRYVISTHYHEDHTGGNGFFRGEGAIIIAQDRCRARLLEASFSPYWNRGSPAIPPGEAPTVTFEHTLTVHFDGEEVTASHLQPAHTDGDAVVFLRTSDVVHLGDLFVSRLYPYVDVGAKGTIDGYFPVIDDVLARIDDRTIVIPGHGPPTDRAGLKRYRDMLRTVRDRVAALIAGGKSLEEIIASRPSLEFDAECATDRVGPDGFAAMVYQSLTGLRLDWRPQG